MKCKTLHYITIHQKRTDFDEGWCETLHYIPIRLEWFGSFYVFCNNACSCVRGSMRFLKLWCQIALEWLHDVACRVLWGGSRSTKACVFPCRVAAAGDEGTSSVLRLRLGSFLSRIVPPMWFATSGCSRVRSSMRFLKLWWQIALEWLHDCCHLVLPRL